MVFGNGCDMKMKKTVYVLMVLLLISTLAACGKKAGGTGEESGPLKVAIIRGNDRFMEGEGNDVSGIEPEIASLIADSTGRELSITVVDSKTALYSAIQGGQADVGFGRIPDSESALKSLSYSRSYGKGGVFFVTKKYDYTDSLSLLPPGTLGVMESVSAISGTVPGIDAFKTETYLDTESLARDVEAGKIAAGICNEREALSLTKEKVQVQEALKGPKESYVAVMPKDSGLVGQVDSAISSYYDTLINPEGTEEQ